MAMRYVISWLATFVSEKQMFVPPGQYFVDCLLTGSAVALADAARASSAICVAPTIMGGLIEVGVASSQATLPWATKRTVTLVESSCPRFPWFPLQERGVQSRFYATAVHPVDHGMADA